MQDQQPSMPLSDSEQDQPGSDSTSNENPWSSYKRGSDHDNDDDEPNIFLIVFFSVLTFVLLFCFYFESHRRENNDNGMSSSSSADNNSIKTKSNTGLPLSILQKHLEVFDWNEHTVDVENAASNDTGEATDAKKATRGTGSKRSRSSTFWTSRDKEEQNDTTTACDQECTDDDDGYVGGIVGETHSSNCSSRSCAICFHTLSSSLKNHERQQQQRVCRSNNPDCPHVFHEMCMIPWLQQSNECPICRQTYVIVQGESV